MKLLLTLLATIPFALFCQTPQTEKSHPFSIGLTVSPDYCYRVLKSDASVKMIVESRDTIEIPKPGYTIGVGVMMRISRRISIESGLLYSNKGEQTKKIWVVVSDPLGLPGQHIPENVSLTYRYYYLDIPFKLNYYILLKKAKLYLTAGISPDIFLAQKTRSIAEYSDGSTTKKTTNSSSDYSFVNVTVLAGIGFSYDLTNRLYLKIEPLYRRSVTSITNTPVKGYLYSFGLNTGVFFRLF